MRILNLPKGWRTRLGVEKLNWRGALCLFMIILGFWVWFWCCWDIKVKTEWLAGLFGFRLGSIRVRALLEVWEDSEDSSFPLERDPLAVIVRNALKSNPSESMVVVNSQVPSTVKIGSHPSKSRRRVGYESYDQDHIFCFELIQQAVVASRPQLEGTKNLWRNSYLQFSSSHEVVSATHPGYLPFN